MGEQGGNLDVALNYAQTAREQQPNDPSIADTLGWLYYKKNAYILANSLLKEAVEKLFCVSVVSVNTMIVPGKKKRMGRYAGYRSDWKKAIVRLQAGQTIAKFGEV